VFDFGFFILTNGVLLVAAFICDEGPIVLNFILVNLPSCSSKHEEFLILLVIDDLPSMLG
jgi:hypothetical protein